MQTLGIPSLFLVISQFNRGDGVQLMKLKLS